MSIVSCTRISLAADEVIFSSHVITKELFVEWLPVSVGAVHRIGE